MPMPTFMSTAVSVLKRLLAALAMLGLLHGAQAGARDDFFRAVNVDNADSVRALLQRGFEPDTLDDQGRTALYLALRDDSPRVVEALLADPRTRIDGANAVGETPLMMAALRGRYDSAQRLLARGAAVNREGWTPLHYAATGPDARVLALLIERGAQLDARSPNGTTALMMAARYGSEASVDRLLKAGASLALRNQQGLAAADFARLDGRDDLAQRLQSAQGR